MDFEFFAPESASDSIRQTTIEFWLSEKAVPEDAAEKRSKRVIAHAVDNNEIIAVVYGQVVLSKLINQPVFAYRTFVAKTRRQKGVATQLLVYVCDQLQGFYMAQDEPAAIGVLLELDVELAEKLNQHLTWPGTEFSYIGKSATGAHLRVRYFEQVKLKPK